MVKLNAERSEPVELPDAVIECVPELSDGIVTVLVQPPFELAVILEASEVLASNVIFIPLSLAAKPAPVTVTELPGAPDVLLIDIMRSNVKP